MKRLFLLVIYSLTATIGQHVALSPNFCAKVFLGAEHQPKVAVLQTLRGNTVEMPDECTGCTRGAISWRG